MGRARPTVLVVDDEAEIRELAVLALTAFGYVTLTATSGDAALAMLEGDFLRIDLLLSDVVMPGRINGFALAERARQIRPELRIVLMSGYIDPRLAAKLSKGLYPVVPKPWRVQHLIDAVEAEFRKQPLLPEAGGDGAA